MADQETSRPVAVIGAGLDLGAGRRGVDMGPSAIRYAGLQERIEQLGRLCADWGDVDVGLPEATEVGDPRARYLESIKRSCERVSSLVHDAREGGYLPLVLGGLARAHGPGAALWVDAHGDLNRPETSPTGNVHGMPLAAAFGVAGDAFRDSAWPTPSVERAALVGVRSLDAGERELIRELN